MGIIFAVFRVSPPVLVTIERSCAMIPDRAPSSLAQVGDVRWIYGALAEADRWSLSLHFWGALSAPVLMFLQVLWKLYKVLLPLPQECFPQKFFFRDQPHWTWTTWTTGVLINLERARIDGNHCKSLWLPSGMIIWRTRWRGTWMARQSHLTYTQDCWVNIVCLQRTNFTSGHQWVLVEVWLWLYHTSVLHSYALVKGWWEREGKEVTALLRQQVPSLFVRGGFVLTTLGKLLSPSFLQAFSVSPRQSLSGSLSWAFLPPNTAKLISTLLVRSWVDLIKIQAK